MVLLCCLLLVGASWRGVLDQQSDAYLDAALQWGSVIYASARGINASVSFLQGTEFTPWFVTLSAGEVLDPINDLIERFSALLLLALGSLALQKIFLAIFTHDAFSLLLTALLALMVCCSTGRFSAHFTAVLRFFLLTAALRFALSLTVLASTAVDHVFLADQDKERHRVMNELNTELATLSEADPGAPEPGEIAAAERELAAVRALRAIQEKEVERLRAALERLEAELGALRSTVPLVCRLNPACDEGERVNAKSEEKTFTEKDLASAEARLAVSGTTAAELKEFLDCARKARAGKPCPGPGRAKSLISPSEWMERFARIEAGMNAYAGNIITLLTSTITRTILIPLLFLYTFLQLYRAVITRLL